MDSHVLVLLLLSILSKIFFRTIEVIGGERIPSDGAVILVGNHPNQFIDAMMIMTHCKRRVSFLIAASSMQRFLIGRLAALMDSIPVVRPQDVAIPGPGTVHVEGTRLHGHGTRFTLLAPGSLIWPEGASAPLILQTIADDTQAEIVAPLASEASTASAYRVAPPQDRTALYRRVWEHLWAGSCIGIFPEGGSHDRSELLPLKAGVCAMALGAMKHRPSVPVTIVCVGLTYFAGHQFRSRVVIEFGHPYRVPDELALAYARDPRAASGQLLARIERNLREVTVTAPDYDTLRAVHVARGILKPTGMSFTLNDYMACGRELSEAFRRDDPAVRRLVARVVAYHRHLEMLRLGDDHVGGDDATSNEASQLFAKPLALRFAVGFCIAALAVPGAVLNLPVVLLAHVVSRKRAKQAKQRSQVKIHGRDVIATSKLLTGIIAAPCLHLVYAGVVGWFLGAVPALAFWVSWPALCWASLRALEEERDTIAALRALLRLRRSRIGQLAQLRGDRRALRAALLHLVERCPLAAAFSPQTPDWRVLVRDKPGYLSPRDELERRGLQIQESYEELEQALIGGG